MKPNHSISLLLLILQILKPTNLKSLKSQLQQNRSDNSPKDIPLLSDTYYLTPPPNKIEKTDEYLILREYLDSPLTGKFATEPNKIKFSVKPKENNYENFIISKNKDYFLEFYSIESVSILKESRLLKAGSSIDSMGNPELVVKLDILNPPALPNRDDKSILFSIPLIIDCKENSSGKYDSALSPFIMLDGTGIESDIDISVIFNDLYPYRIVSFDLEYKSDHLTKKYRVFSFDESIAISKDFAAKLESKFKSTGGQEDPKHSAKTIITVPPEEMIKTTRVKDRYNDYDAERDSYKLYVNSKLKDSIAYNQTLVDEYTKNKTKPKEIDFDVEAEKMRFLWLLNFCVHTVCRVEYKQAAGLMGKSLGSQKDARQVNVTEKLDKKAFNVDTSGIKSSQISFSNDFIDSASSKTGSKSSSTINNLTQIVRDANQTGSTDNTTDKSKYHLFNSQADVQNLNISVLSSNRNFTSKTDLYSQLNESLLKSQQSSKSKIPLLKKENLQLINGTFYITQTLILPTEPNTREELESKYTKYRNLLKRQSSLRDHSKPKPNEPTR